MRLIVIVVLFSVTFFISSQQVVSTMIDIATGNTTVNHTANGEKNVTVYFIVGRRRITQEATCSRQNETISITAPKTTAISTISNSTDKFEDFCQNLTKLQTCLQQNCKWTRGNCKTKNNFPVVPPESCVDIISLFKSVMWYRRTPSRGNATFWLYFLAGTCAVVFFLALGFFWCPLIACCRRLYYRLRGRPNKNDGITMILPQGKKFPTDDFMIRRRVPRRGEVLLKQFLETTRSIPVKTPVATRKEDLESPHNWQFDPNKPTEENGVLFTASMNGCPSVTHTSGAHNYNNGENKCVTKILNIPTEPQYSSGSGRQTINGNLVEVICETENVETYSSTSTRSSFGDNGEIAGCSSRHFNTLNAPLIRDVDRSKNVILVNLQSNLKSHPSSLQHQAGKCHDYIIDRMPMDMDDESTV